MEDEEYRHQRIVYDGKRMRKTIARKAVDYSGPLLKMSLRAQRGYPQNHPLFSFYMPTMEEAPLADSVPSQLAHTSINKVRTPINVVKYAPEGRRLISGAATGEFTLWNGFSFNFETILQAHDTAIRTLSWTRQGDYLLSGDHTGAIKYWQPSMNNLQIVEAHKEAVRDISFSPRDAKFCSASDDGTIKIFDFREAREERTLTGHGWDVRVAQWHKHHSLIASGGKDNLIKLWDPRDKRCTTLHIHKNTILCMQWTPNGESILTGGKDQMIKMFNLRAMKEEFVYKGHAKEVTSLTVNPQTTGTFVSGGGEGGIYFWQLHNEHPMETVPNAHTKTIWSMDYHPVGHLLCTGSVDSSVKFWARKRPGISTEAVSHGGPAYSFDEIPGLGMQTAM
jgi:polyadenylation factor subunit 2